jgi:molybdopterin-binding protein
MNKLPGKIIGIENSNHFYLIEIDVLGQIFSALITETPGGQFAEIGRMVYVVFKDTEVSIGKNLEGEISLRNRFKAVAKNVEIKKILCKITLEWRGFRITSVITAGSARKMNLQNNDTLECLVKATSLSLMEFL